MANGEDQMGTSEFDPDADRPTWNAGRKVGPKRPLKPRHIWAILSELHAARIDLFLHQQGIDTTSPAGKAMFQIMGVFAEFERAMIQERVKAGLSRARAEGKSLGRPRISADKEISIRTSLCKGDIGIRKLAAAHQVGVGTIMRIKRALAMDDLSA
jgi:DNA invertase Pin-like site-specific DNA recombinase